MTIRFFIFPRVKKIPVFVQALFTNVIGKKINAGVADLSKIEILGEKIDDVKVDDFKFPQIIDVVFGPRFLRKFVKDLFTSRPIENKKKCTLCGDCVKSCPPEIISEKNGSLYFDYNRCIRCYCCIEVCPYGAIEIKQGWLVELLGLK